MAVDRTDERTVAGRYARLERLGQGGFGIVWRAHDTLLERDVAMKEVQFPTILDEDEQARLREKVLREARAAARLSHPGLVTVYDVVEEDGRPFIVMELVAAPTLAELVDREGPLPDERVAAIGSGVLDALTEAHAHGIIHRDVKPANVMVHESGRVQLGDFGIASILDDPKVTSSGQLAGSPSFMAPEQAQNRPASAATDLWGLGATLYYAVEGEPPFEKPGAIATLTSVVNDDVRPIRRAGALAPLLRDLLAKDLADRPPVEDVRRRLSEVELGAGAVATVAGPAQTAELPAPPVPAPAPPPSAPMPRPRRLAPARRARPTIGTPVAVVVLLIVIGLMAALVLRDRNRDKSSTTSEDTTATTVAEEAEEEEERDESAAEVSGDWVSYRDRATGFRISYPSGWEIRTSGTITDFRDPSTGAYLRVDHKQPPGPSPEGAWYTLETRFAAENANYQRIQIIPTKFKGYDAALWEFTYSGGGTTLHAVDLGFIAGDYGFALNFQTRAADWERMQPVFEQFKSSFKAPA